MTIGGILFFLAIPIAFLITLFQLIKIYKNRLKENVQNSVSHSFAIFCIFVVCLACALTIILAISAMPIFCQGTGCQAAGYIYMFATPFIILGSIVAEIIYSITAPELDNSET